MDTKKLRQKILDLAIRGKLVPQDPNDEPASVLLERIRAEKERLIKEGKIKRSKKTASDDEIETPFEIPESWEWVRLKSIVSVLGDGIHGTPEYDITGNYYFINGNNLSNNKIVIKADTKKVNENEYQTYKKELNDKTILVSINGTIGNVGHYNGEPVILGKSACYYNLLDISLKSYITMLMYTDYFLNYAVENATGSTIKNVSLAVMNDFVVPLPPIEEQKRIANEIERWFALIDALESNEGDLLKAIDQAKSKILDLAIHGKLVPQDPNDEPAIELLKRTNPKFEPCDTVDCPFVIPQGWEWTAIGECSIYKSVSIDPSKYKDQEFELYSVPSFVTGMPEVVKGAFISSSKKMVEEGDVLLCKINPHLNRTWVVEHHKKDLQCIASSEWIIFRNRDINSQYLMRCFTSSYFLNLMLSNVSGVGGSLMRAQPASVEKYLFPLPPYQEQVRIVSKMEELFSVLDSIKESLE